MDGVWKSWDILSKPFMRIGATCMCSNHTRHMHGPMRSAPNQHCDDAIALSTTAGTFFAL
jgi:hypothetical protein